MVRSSFVVDGLDPRFRVFRVRSFDEFSLPSTFGSPSAFLSLKTLTSEDMALLDRELLMADIGIQARWLRESDLTTSPPLTWLAMRRLSKRLLIVE